MHEVWRLRDAVDLRAANLIQANDLARSTSIMPVGAEPLVLPNAAKQAVALPGTGASVSCGTLLGRLLRDAVAGAGSQITAIQFAATGGGTHDIHALILGRAQTGIQAFF